MTLDKNLSKLKTLDKIDQNILKILQEDGRVSNVKLAQTINLSPTPCLERVKRLEKEGYIKGYVALAGFKPPRCRPGVFH